MFTEYIMSVVNALLDAVAALLFTLVTSLFGVVKLFIPSSYFFKDIKGDIVLVTGGGSGIGRLMCCKFAKKGAIVVTWDINSKGNDETVAMIKKDGGKAYSYIVDISNREEIYSTAEKMKKEVGSPDILVNNAGIVSGSNILDTPDSKIIKTFEVNTFAHFWTIKAFLPEMIKAKKGHVVNIASLAGHSGTNKLVDYCASKFAAVGLDEAFRVELFVQGHSEYIKTTVVCPYYISTGMFAGVQSKLVPILNIAEYNGSFS
ncbi:short-chain dehydrogenase/reductase family 16C member 6 isoform X2 [Eurytemora carolleeae]|uniref:short-chain dehydrogenase/reductase family 16C member 6 isoform X2 n=1 Tax=Eurytemora carolleeae TaxID=1294199 RepID=UPI000C78623C|nr:short-chain dehydrogenase/reductase family 16C member 6 isoform X2 [Eurytemora carolleeae]|eukprot:XP_023342973.1 short-chain dehydrogenase/reductase family 16C member 6-like isoform X2 [Eurytemora affinis]